MTFFYSNVQSKMYNGLQGFFVFCFSPAGYVFIVLVLTLVHPSILFLAVLPLLSASSDPSHHLFSKNTFTVYHPLKEV